MTKHTQVKCKCAACQLHFIVCTWHPEKHSAKSLYCPECGQCVGKFTVWSEAVPQPIFTVVPGAARIEGIGI